VGALYHQGSGIHISAEKEKQRDWREECQLNVNQEYVNAAHSFKAGVVRSVKANEIIRIHWSPTGSNILLGWQSGIDWCN
jgi:hypothetical protein